jgi:hypothetical protein
MGWLGLCAPVMDCSLRMAQKTIGCDVAIVHTVGYNIYTGHVQTQELDHSEFGNISMGTCP